MKQRWRNKKGRT